MVAGPASRRGCLDRPGRFFTARGERIPGEVPPTTFLASWDADLLREVVHPGRRSSGETRVVKWQGPTLRAGIEGPLLQVADVLGDWREEVVRSMGYPGIPHPPSPPAPRLRSESLTLSSWRWDAMRMGIAPYVVLAVLAGVADAAEKPDFSGTWVFNKSRSALTDQRLAKMDRGVFVIQHTDRTFKVTRTFTFERAENTLSFEFPTDGKEVVTEKRGRKESSSIRWLGNTLVFTTRLLLPDEEATNIVHYTLLDDGKTLLAEETFEGKSLKHHNLWLFDKP